MNKIYNLRQDNFFEQDQQLTEMKMSNEQDRRKNEILNGFVFIIGVVGFLAAFFQPRDLVYNRSSLENSFSNSSPLASNSLPTKKMKKNANTLDIESHFAISGFHEVNETMIFTFNGFQNNSEVVYTIDFGNGMKKEIKDQKTSYSYNDTGNYVVKVLAKYKEEEKVIYREKIFIDEAIIVNSEAFVEHN